MTTTAELALDPVEAKQLAESYVAMQRHYAPVVSAKTVDTLRFGMVVAMCYGGRIIAISNRKKAERKKEADAKRAAGQMPADDGSRVEPIGGQVIFPFSPHANAPIQ